MCFIVQIAIVSLKTGAVEECCRPFLVIENDLWALPRLQHPPLPSFQVDLSTVDWCGRDRPGVPAPVNIRRVKTAETSAIRVS